MPVEQPEIVRAIKDELRACKSPDEVHKVADERRDDVKALAKDRKTRVFATHISHLKWYMLNVVIPDMDSDDG